MQRPDWQAVVDASVGTFAVSILPPTIELPALPGAVSLFLRKADDPEVSARELAGIIETDTGLTAELLRFVNSSFLGLRCKAKTVQHTLALLGRRRAKMHILATAAQAAVRARKSRLINQESFWNSSLQKALFAREVARLLRADADLAFSAALLQDYLLPLLSNDLYDDYLAFVSERDRQPECLCDFENKRFGWNHALAGAALAARWHLPADLVCCLLFHHAGVAILDHPQFASTAVAAVALSALLPDALRQHRSGLRELVRLQERWEPFDLQRLAETVDQQRSRIGIDVDNAFPLSPVCRALFQPPA